MICTNISYYVQENPTNSVTDLKSQHSVSGEWCSDWQLLIWMGAVSKQYLTCLTHFGLVFDSSNSE